MSSERRPLETVLDELETTGNGEAVSVGDVLSAFEHRSLGVLLTVFGLIAALPVIGAIPGMSILTGSLILLAVAQSFIGDRGLWAPRSVRRRKVTREKLEEGIEKARPWLRKIDWLLTERLTALSIGEVNHVIIALATVILAITSYPLAFVPFGVTVPALGVVCFGLGMMARDGVLVMVGYLLAGATAWLIVEFLPINPLPL